MCLTTNKSVFAGFLLPAILLLWSTACFAERADRDKPIHLEADQVIMDDAQQISTFIGHVQLSQGSMLIRGDKIVVAEDKDGYRHATAYGDTAEFRQKREGSDGYVEGYGERIEYDARAGTLIFRDKARLKRDLDEVSGDTITYNMKTETFSVHSGDAITGNDRPQRVRAILQPKANESNASPSTAGAVPLKPKTTLPQPKEHE
jgi:lipopolysaccharide export system protein LptA